MNANRRLAAIMVADVVGYSRMMEQDEAATLAALKDRRKNVFEPVVKAHGGRIVKVMGRCISSSPERRKVPLMVSRNSKPLILDSFLAALGFIEILGRKNKSLHAFVLAERKDDFRHVVQRDAAIEIVVRLHGDNRAGPADIETA